jgi:hypothetical protein
LEQYLLDIICSKVILLADYILSGCRFQVFMYIRSFTFMQLVIAQPQQN